MSFVLGVGLSLLLPDKEASAADVESESGSAQSAEEEATALLGGQGTVKKRINGKGRQSEDSDSLLVVVPEAEEGVRRGESGPTDSMDDNNVVGASK